MSTTNWLIFDVTVNNGNDPDGQIQLTFSIVNNVLQGSAVLAYRPNSNANGHNLFTTPSTATATGVSSGTDTIYTLSNVDVSSFNLPKGQIYLGGNYDFINSLVVTVDANNNATLSGQFSDPDGDTPCDWTADSTAPLPRPMPQQEAKGAGGTY